MNKQVSLKPSDTTVIFMEPRLANFDELADSDEAFPDLPKLNLNDLPAMDIMSEDFRHTCASTKVFNEFMDAYNVAFEDRVTLIKGILSMTHGAASTVKKEHARQEKEKYLAQGGKEYYGMYL